nr:uncharacterized protein LOC119161086 [Rhipicephalus microplus]
MQIACTTLLPLTIQTSVVWIKVHCGFSFRTISAGAEAGRLPFSSVSFLCYSQTEAFSMQKQDDTTTLEVLLLSCCVASEGCPSGSHYMATVGPLGIAGVF